MILYICSSYVEKKSKVASTQAANKIDHLNEHRAVAKSRLKAMGAKDKEVGTLKCN